MSASGDLGQQILKTMLRRYEALGGAVALPLSKRVAGLLSMVFYAKATNPQELELSWFFWIVVFLSVWVIYTTSA